MKRHFVLILVAILVLAGLTATAQIQRGSDAKRTCVVCKQEKSVSAFSGDSKTCKGCVKKAQRTCVVCKQKKSVSAFSGDSKTCKACVKLAEKQSRQHEEAERQRLAEEQRRQQEEAKRQRAEAEELRRQQEELAQQRAALEEQRRQQEEAKRRPAEPTAYDVEFTCNVSEATIYIDGNDYGKPNGTRTLKTGSHQVKLMAEGYEDYATTINVASGSTSFDFKMTRAIPKEPYVAKVETFTVKGVSFDMIFVEGGSFTMGATPEQVSDADNDEKPVHKVTLSSYYIGKYEVSQELWQAVMGTNPSRFKGDSRRPVDNVSWDDCQEFISKLNRLTGKRFRLPTEAEWEYAARGGKKSKGYKYSGSKDPGSVAWYRDNSGETTHPVGQKSPNELGLYDMSGNVYEWCQDWKGDYSSDPQTHPAGPSTGSDRVLRGGGWYSRARSCRVSYRNCYAPSSPATSDYGLRLAL